MCDDINHCQLSYDDEIQCDLPVCPKGCQCFGLVLRCNRCGLLFLPKYHKNTLALDLQHNLIKAENIDLHFYTKLAHLDLSQNLIKSLTIAGFQGLKNLILLDVSNNDIRALHGWIFNGLSNIRAIDITSNTLSNILRWAFQGLYHLPDLNLSHQILQHLQEYAFFGLGELLHLDLQSNSIAYLKQRVFSGLVSLTSITLSDNPICHVHVGTFLELSALLAVYVGSGSMCCFLAQDQTCVPLVEASHTQCGSLLGQSYLIFLFPSIASISLLGSGMGVLYQFYTRVSHRAHTPIQYILVHLCDILLAIPPLILYKYILLLP